MSFLFLSVMNFQNIRADFALQCTERDLEIEKESHERLLEAELAVQQQRTSSAR